MLKILLFLLPLLMTGALQGKPVSYGISLSEHVNARINPITNLSGSVSVPLSKTIDLRFSQSASQNYYIDEDEDVIKLHDSILALRFRPKSRLKNWQLLASTSLSLPVSEYSRRNNVITDLGLQSTVLHTPFPSLSIYFSGMVNGHFSQFDSEATGDGGRGSALPSHSYRIGQGASWQFLTKTSLSYSLAQRETFYHKIEDTESPDDNHPTDQFFTFGMTIDQSFDWGSLGLGFSQGNALEVAGLRDYVLFDENRTSGYAQISLAWN